MKPKTQELLQIISKSDSLDQFLDKNDELFIDEPLHEQLERLAEEKNISKPEIIKNSGLDRTYVYQIFQGIRNPNRNKLLAILWAMKCDYNETQSFLLASGNTQLYPYDKRDSIIIFALYHQYSLTDLNEILFDLNYELLE